MNLSEKYEFRSIRKDEADQATEIERSVSLRQRQSAERIL